jgi:hypothetical protein
MSGIPARLIGSFLVFAAVSSCSLFDSEPKNRLQISSVSPAGLTGGAEATISGTGFSATLGENSVTIDGVAATVTAATTTSLTVIVPAFPCAPSRTGVVSVTTGGKSAQTNHLIQPGTAHNLAVGGTVVLSSSAAARCNELHNAAATATYYISVYNTSTTYSTTGASFELKGTAGTAAAILPDVSQAARVTRSVSPLRRSLSPEQEMRRNHQEFLERDLEILRQNRHRWAGQPRMASLVAGGSIAHAVGDAVPLRLRDISKTSCNDFVDIAGRVAYIGTKAIIIEDTENQLAGTIDSTYAQIGTEFDAVMWTILENNFGNALINDASLDNNGRFVMVFTNKVRTLSNNRIAGFVTACDLFARTTFASSNFGEYFYATAPTTSGNINVSGSPPRWRWSMREVIIHEVKHIVSIAERLAKNPTSPAFETSWLEETTATIAEELYERARYGFAQKSNIGYGSQGSPVGPYCGLRLSCNQARGFIQAFEDLGHEWYQLPHEHSPIGRIDSDDFSFYSTGWSLVRWALDRSPTAESTVLKNMIQHPSLTGIANFDAHIGTTYVDALPRWTLAMVVDDHPGAAISNAEFTFPSWNLRSVFAGYKQDFGSQVTIAAWPLQPLSAAFGAFSTGATVRAGTAAIIQLSGAQAGKQLLELKASGSSASAPNELRMSIVRVQ